MSLPPEHATRDIKLKMSNCLSVRANLLHTFQYETGCIITTIILMDLLSSSIEIIDRPHGD